MKTNDYINGFIDREKKTKYNPYLATRIMAKIESPKHKTIGFIRYATVAASITLVITLGVVIGNTHNSGSKEYARLNINDSDIENFSLYNSNENE